MYNCYESNPMAVILYVIASIITGVIILSIF